MIYDCFMFFNEMDLLEIRLNELSPVVDRFVLVEATRTFTLKPKPLYYQENKAHYRAFNDRIIHIVVRKNPAFLNRYKKVSFLGFLRRILTSASFEPINPHQIDFYQKNQIVQGLVGCQPEDVIVFSDLDEIPKPEHITRYKDAPGLKIFELDSFYYYLNMQEYYNEDAPQPELIGQPAPWYGPAMVSFRDMPDPHTLRMAARHDGEGFDEVTVIKDGGWHFSFLGGAEKIAEKIDAYAHQEYNAPAFTDAERLAQVIARGDDLFGRKGKSYRPVPIDETFPVYVQQNQERFKHLIRQVQSID